MRIVSISENLNNEKRVAITPEIAKKYLSLGFEVSLPKNYANHLGIKDDEYLQNGVKISTNENELLNNSDIIVQLGLLSEDKKNLLKENQSLIGTFNPHNNKENIDVLVKKKLMFFL